MPDDADPQVMAATLHAELLRRSAMIATAESLTGGALGDLLSAAPGASDTYLGGVVSYATAVKVAVLGVPESVVAEHGVVSAACATAMAQGVRALLGTDWAVSTTGVAGPDRQEDKPVGLVFVGLAGPDGDRAVELHLTGDRAGIRAAAVEAAVSLALEAVRAVGATG
jgi:PncC family amidohydrolase